jgi:lipoprotein-anchoring transpeptidase ErfK/SrfK
MKFVSRLLLLALTAGVVAGAAGPKPAKAPASPQESPSAAPSVTLPDLEAIGLNYYPRPPRNWLEAQVELARRGFSSGSIDGVRGPQTVAALRAFQRSEELEDTGELDDATREALALTAPALESRPLSAAELAQLQPLAKTWRGKSEQTALAYDNALELAAERFHASPGLLAKLNPETDWSALTPETKLTVTNVERVGIAGKAARLQVRLADHEIEATDENGRVIAHFPVSIAREVEKRPVGELHVTVVIADPNYTFDPAVFPESAEARELGRKLILAPGPNNPVGVAWIGLDRPGYGIHGTPDPEKVGRTESHGCFRLANWDARTLLDLAWVGLPVEIEP